MQTHGAQPELKGFEHFLARSPDDPLGWAAFFSERDIWVSRVPARLDVMGGIADYSGAHVCQGLLGCGLLAALQPRPDRVLALRTASMDPAGLPAETRIPLARFERDGQWTSYADVRALFAAHPLVDWSAYAAGSVFSLLKETGARLPHGFNLLLLGSAPMGAGIASSAAVEMATLMALAAALDLNASEHPLAEYGQRAENEVVGAPCGRMDQLAVTHGHAGRLTHILCRPGSIVGDVAIPPGTAFAGLNTGVRHSVAAAPYADVRIGTFIGRRILNARRAERGEAPLAHLTELGVADFNATYAALLPETMRGAEFLERHGSHEDTATTVQPQTRYRIAGPTRHAIEENARVLRFIESLSRAGAGDDAACIEAGRCMFDAHESYRTHARLSIPEADFLVEQVRARTRSGLYGAKITGGGAGGTVAVFGRIDALHQAIPELSAAYTRETGRVPDLFEGTSPGALEHGVVRYRRSGNTWFEAS